MEGGIRRILLNGITAMPLVMCMLLIFTVPGQASAAEDPQLSSTIEPSIERRVFDEAKIDTEDVEVSGFVGILSIEDFGSNAVYGGRIAYHINELLFIETAFAQSEGGTTSYEEITGGAPILTDSERKLSYYNASIGFNVLPGEAFVTRNLTYNNDLYLITGIGSTTFAGASRYTINYGLGYRLLLKDFVALKFDFRDHLFNMDVISADKLTHNMEFSLGMSFFF
jgi:outer membrane beta-barrel protein